MSILDRFRRPAPDTAERFARMEARLDALEANAKPKPKPEPPWFCSFCGKSQHEVHKLIAGPTSFICNECIALCVNILVKPTEEKP